MCDFACKASATLSIHRKNKHNIITPRMKVTKAKAKKEKPATPAPPASLLPLQQQQQQQQLTAQQVRTLTISKFGSHISVWLSLEHACH